MLRVADDHRPIEIKKVSPPRIIQSPSDKNMAKTRKTPRVNIGQASPNASAVSQRIMNLTVENVVQELLDSDEHDLTALKENAIEFILNNAVEVIQSPSWPMVYQSPSLWNQLLIELNLFLDHYDVITNSASFQDLDIEIRRSIITAAVEKVRVRVRVR